ncbi:hypothetical protein SAY87_024222 [Trapa incisa]|uniref:Uncharacterized protein n=1 Tax=Trapa incisa TaxID=236973 RepID=A0AAN7JF08_9MYRT|nr:hypothetical protein SAY87_024222 [Trapa incisa]
MGHILTDVVRNTRLVCTKVPDALEQFSYAEISSTSISSEIARVRSVLLRSISDKLSTPAGFPLDSPSLNTILRSAVHLHPIQSQSGREISEEFLSSYGSFKTKRTGRAID